MMRRSTNCMDRKRCYILQLYPSSVYSFFTIWFMGLPWIILHVSPSQLVIRSYLSAAGCLPVNTFFVIL